MTRGRHEPLADRFWPKVDRRAGPLACWPWTGTKGRDGYGRVGVYHGTPRMQNAHRVSWELANGPVPAGLHVCHRCDNRICVNPSHLFVGSRSDNMRDMVAKGRQSEASKDALRTKAKLNSAKEFCVRGHPRTQENTKIRSSGSRECILCARIRAAAQRARKVA